MPPHPARMLCFNIIIGSYKLEICYLKIFVIICMCVCMVTGSYELALVFTNDGVPYSNVLKAKMQQMPIDFPLPCCFWLLSGCCRNGCRCCSLCLECSSFLQTQTWCPAAARAWSTSWSQLAVQSTQVGMTLGMVHPLVANMATCFV